MQSGDGASDPALVDLDVPSSETPGEISFSIELPGDAPEANPDAEDSAPPPVPVAAVAPVRPPLPSYAVALIGALALACLALCVALVAALTQPAPAPILVPDASAAQGQDAPEAEAAGASVPSATPADFPASPVPIPVDLITELEAASSEPLDIELSRLLAAIQHGFGTQSARLEPTLRSYVYRMAARFEWNPDTYRIAVTAPDARLADARKALLEELFEEAIAAGRLAIGTGTGPHALTLVTS